MAENLTETSAGTSSAVSDCYAVGDRVLHIRRRVEGTVEDVFAKGINPDSKTIFIKWDDGPSFLYNENEIKRA